VVEEVALRFVAKVFSPALAVELVIAVLTVLLDATRKSGRRRR
jgi:hypothetical protein